MRRRLSLIATLGLFFSLSVSAQPGRYADAAEDARIETNRELGLDLRTTIPDSLAYWSWHRPYIAFDTGSETWLGVFSGPSGDAYEIRSTGGELLGTHLRYRGTCYYTGSGLTFQELPCVTFLTIDSGFQQVLRKHEAEQNAGRI